MRTLMAQATTEARTDTIQAFLGGLFEEEPEIQRHAEIFLFYWRRQHSLSRSGPVSQRDVANRFGIPRSRVRASLARVAEFLRSRFEDGPPPILETLLGKIDDRQGGISLHDLGLLGLLGDRRDAPRQMWVAHGTLKALGMEEALYFHRPSLLWLTRDGAARWLPRSRLARLERQIDSEIGGRLANVGAVPAAVAGSASPFGARHALQLVLGGPNDYNVFDGFVVPVGRRPSRLASLSAEELRGAPGSLSLTELAQRVQARMGADADILELPRSVLKEVVGSHPDVLLRKERALTTH